MLKAKLAVSIELSCDYLDGMSAQEWVDWAQYLNTSSNTKDVKYLDRFKAMELPYAMQKVNRIGFAE